MKKLSEIIYDLVNDLPIPKYAVEFGALDGVRNSNIRKLLENGWKGLWIEPDPINFANLKNNIEGLDVEILNVAISNTQGMTTFYHHPRFAGKSSLVHPLERFFPGRALGKVVPDDKHPQEVMCRRLETILGTREVGYMSIDVEDFDTVVVEDMMSSVVRPHIFSVEFREQSAFDIQYELVQNEYELVDRLSNDAIYKLKVAK